MVRNFVEAYRGNVAAGLATFMTLGIMLCINRTYTDRLVSSNDDGYTPGKMALNCFLAALILLTAGLAAGSSVLRYSMLPYIGRFSLGAYLLHCWMTGYQGHGHWGQSGFSILGQQLVPDMKVVWGWLVEHNSPTLCLLAVLLLFPLPFLLTLAPLFQHFLVQSFNAMLWLINVSYNRAVCMATSAKA